MSKPKDLFIKTSDAHTKDELIEEGFQLISFTDGMWTFINDPNRVSGNFDKNVHLTYSSNLEF